MTLQQCIANNEISIFIVVHKKRENSSSTHRRKVKSSSLESEKWDENFDTLHVHIAHQNWPHSKTFGARGLVGGSFDAVFHTENFDM